MGTIDWVLDAGLKQTTFHLAFMPSLHNILAGIFFHTKTEGKFYFTYFNVPESTFFRVWGELPRVVLFLTGTSPLTYSPGTMVHHHSSEVIQAVLRATVLRLRTREKASQD